MNTQITVHPKLQHYGLTTANLDTMTDWYRKVLGMTVNHRATVPREAQGRAPQRELCKGCGKRGG
jgi:catechol 2,3-dioxygenase-like lactoylglutathione lyase family enzyme